MGVPDRASLGHMAPRGQLCRQLDPWWVVSRPACTNLLDPVREGEVAVGDFCLSPFQAPLREPVCWAGCVLLAFQETSLTMVAQMLNSPPQCRRPGFDPWVGKIPLEKEMATHSSILAWEITWTEEPGGLQSMWSQKVKTGLSDQAAKFAAVR